MNCFLSFFVYPSLFKWSGLFTMFHGIAALCFKVCNAIHLVVWFMAYLTL